jgi:hypothetical protein
MRMVTDLVGGKSSLVDLFHSFDSEERLAIFSTRSSMPTICQ